MRFSKSKTRSKSSNIFFSSMEHVASLDTKILKGESENSDCQKIKLEAKAQVSEVKVKLEVKAPTSFCFFQWNVLLHLILKS